MMRLRDLTRSGWFQRAAGFAAAEFLRLIWWTNRFKFDPPDLYERAEQDMPLIIAFWHGEHFMMPFARRDYPAAVLISRHRDGEINAIAAERFDIETVRGSGSHGNDFHRKGGVGAFKTMVRTLQDGTNMALTADVPKVARKAGLGIIMLARESGRPILPMAIATSRFKRMNNWDRSVIHLPFGRGVIASGETVRVPADASETEMEQLRVQLQERLNEVNRRAYRLVGKSEGICDGQ
jgi:lysophospholipid acyltransferase (LPLAT)-like uncharacterized protein